MTKSVSLSIRTTMITSRFNCNGASIVVALLVIGLLTECTASGNSICAPSSCGHFHNISYPLRLQDDPKHCGDSGIVPLECDHNNVTVLRLFSHDYHVKAINYDNGTIRVVDPGLDKNNCSSLPLFPLSKWNFSFWQVEDPFYPSFDKTVIFLKCAKPVNNSSRYVSTAPCISQSENTYGYVIVDRYSDFSAGDLENGCTVYSMALINDDWGFDYPFDPIINVTYQEIHNLMAEGFNLEYIINDACLGAHWTVNYKCFPRSIRGFIGILVTGSRSKRGFIVIVEGSVGILISYGRYILIGIFIVLGARFVFGSLFVSALLIRKWRRRHLSAYHTIEDFLNTDSFAPIRYSYFNIKKMANGFKDKLGAGGFGSVYKCKLRSGRFGAIKLLNKSKSKFGEDFMSEVATIGRIHHVNVVQLVGYCVEGSKHALVYDFMPNSSLDKYIFSNNEEFSIILSYIKMFEIAVGVAQGIEYLHQGCEMQILHFDIKPHNILLDENFVPKISDFGLAKLYPANNNIVSTMAARGTMGYIAPELFYKNIGVVSYKADVYSFGMLLMEMASRRKNFKASLDHSSHNFPSWVHDQYNEGKEFEIGDDATEEEKMLTRKMIMVALWCIQMRPSDRPSMKRVIQMLVGDVEDLELPPKPSMYPQVPQPTPESNPQIQICSDAELPCTLSAR